MKAFNIAEKYQIPVFILTDTYFADSVTKISGLDVAAAKTVSYRISKEDSKKIRDYKRYRLTDTGISPMAVPSWIDDPVYLDSDEHTEAGHITESAEIRVQMVNKRFHKKMEGLSRELAAPVSGNLDSADLVLVGFGSNLGVMIETSAGLKKKRIGYIHLPQVWPFPSAKVKELLNGAKKILTIENNAGAQLAGLMMREAGIQVDGSILKYDGRPFDLDYVMEALQQERPA